MVLTLALIIGKIGCSSYNLDNSLKPFWEHFKIHQAKGFLRMQDFFVKDGYLLLKEPKATVKIAQEVDSIFYDSIKRKNSHQKKGYVIKR